MAIKIQLKRGEKDTWKSTNPLLGYGEPGYEKAYYDETQKAIIGGGIKIGDGIHNWNELPYLNKTIIEVPSEDELQYPTKEVLINPNCFYRTRNTGAIYTYDNEKEIYIQLATAIEVESNNNLLILDIHPEEGKTGKLYLIKDKLYIYSEEISDFILLNPDPISESVVLIDELPNIGEVNKIYRINNTQSFYFWNTEKESFDELNSLFEDKAYIIAVDKLPPIEEGKNDVLYKENSTQAFYYFDSNENDYRLVNTNIEVEIAKNLIVVEELPEIGEEDKIYKLSSTQKLFYWNSIQENYEQINNFEIDTDSITSKGFMEIVDELPVEENVKDNVLYKLSSNQELYYWDSLNKNYILVGNKNSDENEEEIQLFEYNVTVEELPEIGEENKLYKTSNDQKYYYWDSVNSVFLPIQENQLLNLNYIDTNSEFEFVSSINQNNGLISVEKKQRIGLPDAAESTGEIFNDYEYNIASGKYSHAEGEATESIGKGSHAEGQLTTAVGDYSHAEGYKTITNGLDSHAEGWETITNGITSHAEGYKTEANGNYSHVGGYMSTANKEGSFVNGLYLQDSNDFSNVFGKYNILHESDFKFETKNDVIYFIEQIPEDILPINPPTYLFAKTITLNSEDGTVTLLDQESYYANSIIADRVIGTYYYNQEKDSYLFVESVNIDSDIITLIGVEYLAIDANATNDILVLGNGKNEDTRSNAFTVDYNGNVWLSGDLYIGSVSGTHKDNGSLKVLTTKDLENGIEIEAKVKEYIIYADTFNDLPLEGDSGVIYKVNDEDKFYIWNKETSAYHFLLTSASNLDTPVEGGGGIIVVEKFTDLPRPGAENVLYKVSSEQLLYTYNSLTGAYEALGQSGGAVEGYKITLQNVDSRIFATIKGERAIIKFIYASIDKDGLNDGPGIGTITVNDIRKATVAIPQKEQELDITDYLSLGANTLVLTVENSETTAKLSYQIELVDLYLTTNVKAMDTYRSETVIPFSITGSGYKDIYYYMDGKLLAEEKNLYSTNVYSHSYRVPMQEAGDHILKIYAERIVNNMVITSNVLTLGMMFTTNEMVDTHILSTFEQKTSTQGEIISIPYMVYNPLLQTANVILTIYNEDGSTYFTKEITVDQTVQNWITQDYPAGKVTFEIQAHSDSGVDAVKQFVIDIEPSTFELSTIRSGLAFEFSAAGRSNSEANPEHWEYYDEYEDVTYTGEFERFAWSGADGWVESDAGETVLRLLPKNKFTIPFYPFKEDKRSTGYTIEIELETRDVANQDAVVLTCMSGGRGIQVNAQQVFFKSALAETSMYFKEDERVRITIVVEASTQDRVIYMFINGIICAATTYEENDNFQQTTPVPIVIGSDDCGIDLYKIRFYNRSFTFREQLENYMCDRSTNAERFEIKERNDIYDISDNITPSSLPPEIPYMVLQCEELPQFKGDKKKSKSCYFVDQLRPERCFSATDVQFDVQGTSSAGYPIKNFKVKFGDSGITYNNGTTAAGYPIVNDDDLISKCLCLKADYASSEQANNVVLVDFYEEVVKDYFLSPAQKAEKEKIQQENPKMTEAEALKKIKTRTGISGRPIVVFWENTTTGEIKFQGQYNMNNDKSNENVFGFDRDIYPELECWEFCNNTSDRCLFKESEYEELIYDKEKKKYIPAWTADFEPRFPDLDDTYDDYTNYKRLTDWVVSTRQDQATGNTIPSVTYDGVTYNKDTAEYRLAKFKAEFEDYFEKDPVIFYYIFTEVFLMIDSRAKNMFLTSFDGQHWFPIPYDMDTAIGINNEGKLVFDYDLEDTDYMDNAPVYNGQESTLWINVRDAFLEDIYDMYDKLRTSNKFSYEIINERMNQHQEKCWPESIWNEDAKLKYVDVFLNTGTNYLEMCQGNKKTQREWWLFNTFKYRDSKYRTGDAQKIIATFRAYAPDDMYITPYQHLWPRVDFTDSYPVTQRSKKNVVNKLENPLDTANDTEMFIRSADRISSFGDLSRYLADTVNFAAATKLQDITLGSDAEGYTNYKLSSLAVGNNRLLTYLNVENCTALNKTIDVSQCFNLETIDAFGSALPSITLPAGGHLMHLNLPATISNFEIKNQHMIQTFNMESYNNLETLVIDDTPGLPVEDLLLKTPKLNCVRIVNTSWNVSSEEKLKAIFDKITAENFTGKDVNGDNTDKAIVTGQVHIDSISDEFLIQLNDYFPELIVYVKGRARFFLRYLNWNNELLYRAPVSIGDNAIDPVALKLIETPLHDGGEDTIYTYSKWSSLPTNVQGPQSIVAMFDTKYRVQFFDGDDNLVNTQWIVEGEAAIDPVETEIIELPTKTSTAQFNFIYAKWDSTFNKVMFPQNVYAMFSEFLRSYNVYFYNGDTLLKTFEADYGSCVAYNDDDSNDNENDIQKIINGVPSDYYEFAYWSPNLTTPIEGETYYYAQFTFFGYIEDDWSTIISNVSSGNSDIYGYAGRKKQSITYHWNNVEHTDEIEFEIIDKNHDILQYANPNYNNNATTAGLTFKGALSIPRQMNLETKLYGTNSTLNGGGWEKSDLREWLNTVILEALPPQLQAGLRVVEKKGDNGYYGKNTLHTVYDKIFIPSLEELNVNATDRTNATGQGTPYVLYTDDSSRKIEHRYWTRSTYNSAHGWNIIPAIDDIEFTESVGRAGGASTDIYIVFCFCV